MDPSLPSSFSSLIKDPQRDFSGGPVVKNPSYIAEDLGSIPGQGTKIPHATGQLSPQAARVCSAMENPT